MLWIVLEMGVALFLLAFIVWWTMFHGKTPNPPAQQKPLPRQDDTQQ